MKYPNRLKELRDARGLTQGELADAVNTSPQQISRLEKGERRLSDHWMALIAPVLKCQPWQLLTDHPSIGEEERSFMADMEFLAQVAPEDYEDIRDLLRKRAERARARRQQSS